MKTSYHDNFLFAGSLIAGQLLSAVSSFFWNSSGAYTVNGATFLILAMILWAVGFTALFGSIKEKLPLYSRLGLAYGFYGCLGGIAFGYEGLYAAVLGDEKLGVKAFEQFPTQMNLVLFWAGPAFPITLLLFGIVVLWKKLYSVSAGVLLIIGAIGFPLSRILRISMVAHVVDVVLLTAVVILSIEMLRPTHLKSAAGIS